MRINPFEVVFCDRIRIWHPRRLYDRQKREDLESCGIIVHDPIRGVSIEFSPARLIGRVNILPVSQQELRVALESVLDSLSGCLNEEEWKVSSVDLAMNREVVDPSNFLSTLARVGYFHSRQSQARIDDKSVQGRFPTLYWETGETLARVYSKAEESKSKQHLLSSLELSSLTKMIRLELRLKRSALSRTLVYGKSVAGFLRFMSRNASKVFNKRMEGLLLCNHAPATGSLSLFDELAGKVGRNSLCYKAFAYIVLADESMPEIAAMKLQLSQKQLREVRKLVNSCSVDEI